jgi:hypothetical protein
MSGVWHFPSNARGKIQGFNDAGVDILREDPVGQSFGSRMAQKCVVASTRVRLARRGAQ